MTVARSWRHATPRRDHGTSPPSDNTHCVVIPSPPYLFGNSSTLLFGVSSPSNDRSTRDPPPPADEAWVLGATLSTPFSWRLRWHLPPEAPCTESDFGGICPPKRPTWKRLQGLPVPRSALYGKRLRWHLPHEAPCMESDFGGICPPKRPAWKATSVAFAPPKRPAWKATSVAVAPRSALHGSDFKPPLPQEASYTESDFGGICSPKRPAWKATSVAFAPRSALREKRLRWHLPPEAPYIKSADPAVPMPSPRAQSSHSNRVFASEAAAVRSSSHRRHLRREWILELQQLRRGRSACRGRPKRRPRRGALGRPPMVARQERPR